MIPGAVQEDAPFRLLFAANPLPTWLYDSESLRFLEVNDAAVGSTSDAFAGFTLTVTNLTEAPTAVSCTSTARSPPAEHLRPLRPIRAFCCPQADCPSTAGDLVGERAPERA